MTQPKAALLGTVALFTSAAALSAQTLTPVAFGTNWVAQAEHGGYYQAAIDGTYAACGLDVTIVPGGPQVNNRAQLLAGRVQFYMGGPATVIAAAQEGVPLVAVSSDFQKDPQVLMTHPGAAASIEEVADLSTFIIGDEGFVTFFPYLEGAYGFDPARRVPYTFNPSAFIANESSAQQGYVTSEPFAIASQAGWTPDVWLLADLGYPAYSTMIITMQPTIEQSPEVVRCFVEGSAIGWANFLYGDNEAALAAISADNPELTPEQLEFSINAMLEYGIVDSGDAETLGIGALNAERMQAIYEILVAAGAAAEGIDITTAYSLEFANNGVSLPVSAALRAE